nr:hypothetical protein [Endozoicomonas sp.]
MNLKPLINLTQGFQLEPKTENPTKVNSQPPSQKRVESWDTKISFDNKNLLHREAQSLDSPQEATPQNPVVKSAPPYLRPSITGEKSLKPDDSPPKMELLPKTLMQNMKDAIWRLDVIKIREIFAEALQVLAKQDYDHLFHSEACQYPRHTDKYKTSELKDAINKCNEKKMIELLLEWREMEMMGRMGMMGMMGRMERMGMMGRMGRMERMERME